MATFNKEIVEHLHALQDAVDEAEQKVAMIEELKSQNSAAMQCIDESMRAGRTEPVWILHGDLFVKYQPPAAINLLVYQQGKMDDEERRQVEIHEAKTTEANRLINSLVRGGVAQVSPQ
eukprot:m51a1_g6346 hypothetical protein (119) ;mRNA; f:70002-70444